METLEIKIKGIGPMLQHNGQLSDPLNKYTKELAVCTSKRKKTDDDHMAVAKAEFNGGLYRDTSGKITLPTECVDSMIRDAAKLRKLGKAVFEGVVCTDAKFKFDGPNDPDKRFAKGLYLRKGVRVGQQRVIRTRPMFDGWTADLTIAVDDTVIDVDDVVEAIHDAGHRKGIGDWRPKYGRFIVE